VKKHVKSIHEGIKFNCGICNKGFTQNNNLERHVLRVHEGIKEVYEKKKCNICNETILWGHLKRHMETVHEKKTLQCNFCDAIFYRVDRLQFHLGTVHEESKFECNTCGEKFKQESRWSTCPLNFGCCLLSHMIYLKLRRE
jgi:hypothetical protein